MTLRELFQKMRDANAPAKDYPIVLLCVLIAWYPEFILAGIILTICWITTKP